MRDEPNNQGHHSDCSSGHHCYHTVPGQYGTSGRDDTYDDSRCCKCGRSAPNPYENDRR